MMLLEIASEGLILVIRLASIVPGACSTSGNDPRTTEHYDRARGNLDRHGVHFLTAYVAGVLTVWAAPASIPPSPRERNLGNLACSTLHVPLTWRARIRASPSGTPASRALVMACCSEWGGRSAGYRRLSRSGRPCGRRPVGRSRCRRPVTAPAARRSAPPGRPPGPAGRGRWHGGGLVALADQVEHPVSAQGVGVVLDPHGCRLGRAPRVDADQVGECAVVDADGLGDLQEPDQLKPVQSLGAGLIGSPSGPARRPPGPMG